MKKHFFTIGLFSLAFLLSCESELNKTNPSVYTSDSYFSNVNELEAGVNSVYAIVQGQNLFAREYFFLHDLRSDEAASGGAQLEPARNEVLTGTLSPANSVMGANWNGLFRTIHRANVIIGLGGGLKTIKEDEEAKRKRIIAEARFWRAWAYYELATGWGGVPLYTTYASSANDVKPRATVEEVFAFVIKELQEAQTDLPLSYSGTNIGRAPKAAAQLQLARAYMFTGDYTKAKAELLKIKDSGSYSLVDKFSDNFIEETEYNKESILEMAYDNAVGTLWDNGDADKVNWSGPRESTVRHQEYSAVGWRNVIPSNKLIDEFERPSKGDAKRDPRMGYTLYFKGDPINNGANQIEDANNPVQGNTSVLDGVTQKISWKKYSLLYKTTGSYIETDGINMRVMRYAEVLLNLAECENELGNASAAIGYLNQIRNRADVQMPSYPTARFACSNKDEIFAAVMHEKMVEMAGEQVRDKDLLRWRKQGKLKTEPISYFQAKHALLPIPQGEIDRNASITANNPGY